MSRELLAEAAQRARPVTLAGQQVLPVPAPLAPLFPDRGLRRGTTITVRMDHSGATSLAMAATAAATQAGSWCAALGWPALGMVAAAGLGVALERFALVPEPGPQWAAVAAALIDAVDVLLLRPPRGVQPSVTRRLAARGRERGVVLIVAEDGGLGVRSGAWTGDLRLSVTGRGEWQGLGKGFGHLQARSLEVTAVGRGAASRPRRVQLWLPGRGGDVEAAERAEADLRGWLGRAEADPRGWLGRAEADPRGLGLAVSSSAAG